MAPESKVNDILNSFEDAFRQIKAGEDYYLNIQEVDRNFHYLETKPYNAIHIIAGTGKHEERTSGITEIPKVFTIYGFVYDPLALQSTAVKMIDDINTAIGKNQDNIKFCTGVQVVEDGPAEEIFQGGNGEAPGYAYPHACMKVVCKVEYRINNSGA
ncbi:hypothetical protein KAR91_31285 [Candidatus Pacearchaeota archaeon]|nr:hypothetical protein [Candidatus Pacearchaeota archaeon]